MSRRSDCDRGVSTELRRRVTTFPRCVRWQLITLFLSAFDVLGVSNSRSQSVQCTDREHKTFLLGKNEGNRAILIGFYFPHHDNQEES